MSQHEIGVLASYLPAFAERAISENNPFGDFWKKERSKANFMRLRLIS
jgi:hypothetical protein